MGSETRQGSPTVISWLKEEPNACDEDGKSNNHAAYETMTDL